MQALSRLLIQLFLLGAAYNLTSCHSGNENDQAAFAQKESVKCEAPDKQTTVLPRELSYRIVARYPHSTEAFTQGLAYRDGVLYESAGLYEKSSLSSRTLSSIEPTRQHKLADQLFAEGATLAGNEIVQLTWKSGKVFRYSLPGLEALQEQQIKGEGWGLTFNGEHLINSNGSATLTFRHPAELAIIKTVDVTYANRPLQKLNELEWAYGCVLANIWHSDDIAFIEPESGKTLYTVSLATG